MKNNLIAVLYVATGAIGYAVFYTLMSSSPSGKTMAALSAWWLCLYICSLAAIRPSLSLQVAILISAISVVDFIAGGGLFRPQGGSMKSQAVATAIGVVVYIAPIFINHFTSYLRRKISLVFKSKSARQVGH